MGDKHVDYTYVQEDISVGHSFHNEKELTNAGYSP